MPLSNYNLTYLKIEDRLLISAGDDEAPVVLTRRLTRELLKTVARVVSEQKSATSGGGELARGTVLLFEQSKAIAESRADGSFRREQRRAPDVGRARVATSFEIAAGKSGGMTLMLKQEETLLTLRFDARGTYVFLSALLDSAATAGWDFPAVASWLETGATSPQGQHPPTVIH